MAGLLSTGNITSDIEVRPEHDAHPWISTEMHHSVLVGCVGWPVRQSFPVGIADLRKIVPV
jgi:hypothetical protein